MKKIILSIMFLLFLIPFVQSESCETKLYMGTYPSGLIEVFDGSWSTSYDTSEYAVWSLGVYEDELFAGTFNNGKIYKFDGCDWVHSYSTGEQDVKSFVEYDGKLYASTGIRGKIFVYDGSWSLAYDSDELYMYSLKVYGGKLYVGTGRGVDNIAKILVFDGSTWETAYDTKTAGVYSLETFDGKLYAGTGDDGKIFVYDGSWSLAYDSSEDWIFSLQEFDNKLYAGTDPNGMIYVFDGVTWNVAYDSPAKRIISMEEFDNKLYAGSTEQGHVYVYDGSWSLEYDDTETWLYSLQTACLDSCSFCGNGIVDFDEECEYPNTDDNGYCSQSTERCSGNKLGTRDAFGYCESDCFCDSDPYSYQCVEGECGAECDSDDDCDDQNPNTLDTCNLDSCGCEYESEPYCGDGIIDPSAGEECELPNTVLASCDAYGFDYLQDYCDSECHLQDDNCEDDYPLCTSDPECDELIPGTGDCDMQCQVEEFPECGDGLLDPGEQCEYPFTSDNIYCGQSQMQCSGVKLGTRDFYGNCGAECSCIEDPLLFSCVQGFCGAECDSDSDCDDQNPHTTDTCNLISCACEYEGQPYCGDGLVFGSEECEYPTTSNNPYCAQTEEECFGTKLGIRDFYGDCNGGCYCEEDQFEFECVEGMCGAQCDSDDDCGPHGTCTDGCVCEYDSYCGDGYIDISAGEECEPPSYVLAECDFQANFLQDYCDSNCKLQDDNCEDDYPGCTSDPECDEQAPGTGNCDWECQYEEPPFCGDGELNFGEECELPSTFDNALCTQHPEECFGNKLGTRDIFGDCNGGCYCEEDQFELECVERRCGAECDSNDDCDDHDEYTIDTCNLDSCGCEYEDIPYCGDGRVFGGEECELPSTSNNNDCDQSTQECLGNKLGTRDSYGDCDEVCGCVEDNFEYECVKFQCGAECAIDADCDDQNEYTIDTCNQDGCGCEYEQLPYCGDGILNLGEQCELAGTDDNSYCDQHPVEDCLGKQYGTRDLYGACDLECGCEFDRFEYQCVEGMCGAECAVDADCGELGVCTSGCVCEYDSYCGDGIIDQAAGEECELPNTVLASCNLFGADYLQDYCDSECHLQDDNCEDDYPGCTSDWECDELAPGTGGCDQVCQVEEQPFCGDEILQFGEECELPSTSDNTYCDQGAEQCFGMMLGTRDSYGDCNARCDCTQDQFELECVEGRCGAICDSDDDCNDFNPTTIDTCNLDSCGCQYEYEPYCGNGILDAGEQCEPPGTVLATCDFGADYLQDYCDSNCMLQDDNCEDDYPGCTSDWECDEQAPGTAGCDQICQYEELPECGDGNLDFGEECEYPSTSDNTYCDQGAEQCFGMKLGVRDSYGDCDARCYCSDDSFELSCVIDRCGAECVQDSDCDDQDEHTIDTCNLDSCACEHEAEPYCGDGEIDPGEECDPPNTNLPTCDFGEHYLQDYCNSECLLEDSTCEDDYEYCNADPDCDELEPGTGDCDFECQIPEPCCGDGEVTFGEDCELPDTTDNIFCPQSTQDCLGPYLGTRDSLGDCDGACGCEEDDFDYQCVEGECGAECDSNIDCDSNSCIEIYPDMCIGNKLKEYNGDHEINFLLVADFCDNSCQGDCSCTDCEVDCSEPPATTECVEDVCNAECDEDSDCDDQNSNTLDTCNLDSCGCEHEEVPYCGDGRVFGAEECESPSTSDNLFCDQSPEQCLGTKLGTRDTYGDCDEVCACEFDDFNYECVEGECGAECTIDADCDDQNEFTTDTCNLDTCGCEYEDIPYCGDGIVFGGEVCELPNTLENTYCIQSTEECFGVKLGTRDSYGDCGEFCVCDYDDFNMECVEGECEAECDSDDDCDDSDPYTLDTCNTQSCGCEYEDVPYCGDGIVFGAEECELPNTADNTNCDQSPEECLGNKLGTRDTFGDCDALCGCDFDDFNYECIVGVCGATCIDGTSDSQQCGQTDVGECEYGEQWRTCTGDCIWGDWGQCRGEVGPTQEICDGLDNDCDGEIDEDIDSIPCGSGQCSGVMECIAGAWTDCSTYTDDCGICALCDIDGECTIYDWTQDEDCSDTICIDDCDLNPDDIYWTWDFADDVPNQCLELGLCTQNECQYEHECSVDLCGAECEEDLDCDELKDCIVSGPEPDQGWKFAPRLFIDPGSREIFASNMDGGGPLVDRTGSYAFEGEKIVWDVLVWDKNGMPEKIWDVFVAVAPSERPEFGTCDEESCSCDYPEFEMCWEANCDFNFERTRMIEGGFWEGEEHVTEYNPYTMGWYTCTFTVESRASMYGSYEIQPQAWDVDGLRGGSYHVETWFFNPNLALSIDDGLEFGELLPGHTAYDTVTIGNDAEGGVVLDMAISGTDFYDPEHSGGKCPFSNVMLLNNGDDRGGDSDRGCDGDNFCYYAVNGAYNTHSNYGADPEGYDSIPYEMSLPSAREPIIDSNHYLSGGAEISMTFKLEIPEPCNGNFNDGAIYFWGSPV